MITCLQNNGLQSNYIFWIELVFLFLGVDFLMDFPWELKRVTVWSFELEQL